MLNGYVIHTVSVTWSVPFSTSQTKTAKIINGQLQWS
jgi:hypothetical protein